MVFPYNVEPGCDRGDYHAQGGENNGASGSAEKLSSARSCNDSPVILNKLCTWIWRRCGVVRITRVVRPRRIGRHNNSGRHTGGIMHISDVYLNNMCSVLRSIHIKVDNVHGDIGVVEERRND